MLHLNRYLSSNSLLVGEQFGFRSGHSTSDQLLLTYNDISLGLDSGYVVDLVFFDFSKAFDKVSHSVLLTKLLKIGISQQLLMWIRCFLTSRVMQVRVSSVVSDPVPVTSGVPQGSVLGPILFLIYVNHVVTNLKCNYKIFADDVKLYLTHQSSLLVAEEVLQSDIDMLVETSASWGLLMNVEKCKCIRFSPGSRLCYQQGPSPYNIGVNAINYTANHTDLGIIVDNTLKFHKHIQKVVNTCNAMTTNIFSSTVCRDSEFLMNIYVSYIRPKLDYCSNIWNTGYIGDIRILERVQRRWTRAVRGLENMNYGDRLKQLNLFSVQGRLLRSDLITVWKVFNGKCAISPDQLFNLTTLPTRGHRFKIYKPRHNLEVRRRSFAHRVIDDWNSLPSSVVESNSITVFKRLLQVELGPRLFNFLDY